MFSWNILNKTGLSVLSLCLDFLSASAVGVNPYQMLWAKFCVDLYGKTQVTFKWRRTYFAVSLTICSIQAILLGVLKNIKIRHSSSKHQTLHTAFSFPLFFSIQKYPLTEKTNLCRTLVHHPESLKAPINSPLHKALLTHAHLTLHFL